MYLERQIVVLMSGCSRVAFIAVLVFLLLLSSCSWFPIKQFGRSGGSVVIAADQPLCMIRIAAYTNPAALVFEFGLRGHGGEATAMSFVPSQFGPKYSMQKTYWMPFEIVTDEIGWVPTQCNP